jgi:hypothetical protein
VDYKDQSLFPNTLWIMMGTSVEHVFGSMAGIARLLSAMFWYCGRYCTLAVRHVLVAWQVLHTCCRHVR